MPSFTIETCLSVDSYLDEEDPDDTEFAFDDCRSDLDGARIAAREDMAEYLTDKQMAQVAITSVAFLEFDSNNVSHAGGYFEVHCTAPQDVIDALTGEDKLIQPSEEDGEEKALRLDELQYGKKTQKKAQKKAQKR